jgi:hypothetical protein
MLSRGAIVFILIEPGMSNLMARVPVSISSLIFGSNEIEEAFVARTEIAASRAVRAHGSHCDLPL